MNDPPIQNHPTKTQSRTDEDSSPKLMVWEDQDVVVPFYNIVRRWRRVSAIQGWKYNITVEQTSEGQG